MEAKREEQSNRIGTMLFLERPKPPTPMKHTLILKPDTTFEDAVKLLDQNAVGFLAVTDKELHLIGTLTDGDIRRAVLKRETDLMKIINQHPVTAKVSEPKIKIRQRLREKKIRHMPVVDEEGKLVNVVLLDEFEADIKPNHVVIMAGGLGSRLGELTEHTPKPMLPVGNKPMLEHIIDNFKAQGFVNFIICVNYKSHVIEDYFGDGSAFGVQIGYTHEKKRMGTAGALSLIEEVQLQGLPFFVVNGDVLTTLSYEDFMNFHIRSGSKATMCIKKYSYEIPYACVNFDEDYNLTELQEKPMQDFYINAGMYVLDPSVLKKIPANSFYDMPSLFDELVGGSQPVKVFSMNEYWLDIGQPKDYQQVQKGLRL